MENIIKEMNQYIEDALSYYDLPGLAVSVGVQDQRYERAVGQVDITTGEQLEPDHIFHMASVSKLFTSTGILQLCMDGKLDLDSSLGAVLPYVTINDKRMKEIKIKHMLTHTSGMADVEDYHWDAPRTDEGALKHYGCSDEVKHSHMLWSPEENKFRYSNMAYELLGLIIAEVSGMSYEAYMKKFILEPLGMEKSTFLTFVRAGGSLDLGDLKKAGMAMPHTKDADKHIILEPQYPYNREHGPSSTLTSNLADLEKWARVHIKKEFFPEALYKKIWTAYTTVPNNGEGMGLGWFMRRQGDYDIYGHEGTDDGFRSSFWICPQLSAYVIVASNISRGAVKKINKKLFDMIIHSV